MVATVTKSQSSMLIERTIEIAAPIQIAFEVLLDQLGPDCEFQSEKPMPMKLEAWPGGRWFRELGENGGHWWCTVQVIKPPTLIEIHGPLFMSYPAPPLTTFESCSRCQLDRMQSCDRRKLFASRSEQA